MRAANCNGAERVTTYRALMGAVAAAFVVLAAAPARADLYNEDFEGAHNWALNVSTGVNAAEANRWVVDASEGTASPPGCLATPNGNHNLHISAAVTSYQGALYDGGGLCGFIACVESHTRAESPAFSTVGYENITLDFDYLAGSLPPHDVASVWYDAGSGWTLLGDNLDSGICPTNTLIGKWSHATLPLPADAANKASVKIAFHWMNNDDGMGVSNGTAIDNISVTGTVPPVPVDCVVTPYGPFSTCSAACGSGTMTRSRTIVTPAANGGAPCPPLVDVQPCNTQPCAGTCGDTQIQSGEQCDDGNTGDGDGCSASCQLEPEKQVRGYGPPKKECIQEWLTTPPAAKRTLTCTDDDPSCDYGAATGDKACTFQVAMCFNISDSRLNCSPQVIREAEIMKPGTRSKDPVDIANRAALISALTDAGGVDEGRCRDGALCTTNADCKARKGPCHHQVAWIPALTVANQCTRPARIVVPLDKSGAAHVRTRTSLKVNAGPGDADLLWLVCNPK